MGNAESSNSEDFSNDETLGYRVLGVQPNSPAEKAGLVSFLDFLVGCNGRMLFGAGTDEDEEEYIDEDEELGDINFSDLLKDNEGKEVELLVYNIKSKQTRFCYMTPGRGWGGQGLIGVTIRVDSYGGADENLLRILSVIEDSPAANAGLEPEKDYLLGTQTVSFSSDQVLYEVLVTNYEQSVTMYAYNTENDIVRTLTLIPTDNWGEGHGLLGAEVGSGFFHRFPEACRETNGTSSDGSLKSVSSSENNDTIVDDGVINHNETDQGPVNSPLNHSVETIELEPSDESNEELPQGNLSEESPLVSPEPEKSNDPIPLREQHTGTYKEDKTSIITNELTNIARESVDCVTQTPSSPNTTEKSSPKPEKEEVKADNQISPSKPMVEKPQILSNAAGSFLPPPPLSGSNFSSSTYAASVPDDTRTFKLGGLFSSVMPPPPVSSSHQKESLTTG